MDNKPCHFPPACPRQVPRRTYMGGGSPGWLGAALLSPFFPLRGAQGSRQRLALQLPHLAPSPGMSPRGGGAESHGQPIRSSGGGSCLATGFNEHETAGEGGREGTRAEPLPFINTRTRGHPSCKVGPPHSAAGPAAGTLFPSSLPFMSEAFQWLHKTRRSALAKKQMESRSATPPPSLLRNQTPTLPSISWQRSIVETI